MGMRDLSRRSFQSTLPQGERPFRPDRDGTHRDFNPRSHKGSDLRGCSEDDTIYLISIHAPTRGATRGTEKQSKKHLFQSTLPQGERPLFVVLLLSHHYFNPRSHKGSDYTMQESDYSPSISIHAPTRGATTMDFEMQRIF